MIHDPVCSPYYIGFVCSPSTVDLFNQATLYLILGLVAGYFIGRSGRD